MKVTDMTDNLFDREVQKLLSDISFWLMRLTCIDTSICLNLTTKNNTPFPLYQDLKILWDYARGTGPKHPAQNDIIQALLEICWHPVQGVEYTIPAAWWETPFGTMIKMCWAREKIDADLEVSPEELALFTDVTGRWIRKQCKTGKIKAIKTERKGSSQEEWAIPADQAKEIINKVRGG